MGTLTCLAPRYHILQTLKYSASRQYTGLRKMFNIKETIRYFPQTSGNIDGKDYCTVQNIVKVKKDKDKCINNQMISSDPRGKGRKTFISIETERIAHEFVTNPHNITEEYWKKIGDTWESYRVGGKSNHWPTPIMVYIAANDEYDSNVKLLVAEKMLRLMESCGPEANITIHAAFLSILASFGPDVKEQRIWTLYQDLCVKTNNTFDYMLADRITFALAHTKYYKEGLKILKELDYYNMGVLRNYNHIILGAVLHGDYQTAMELFKFCEKNMMSPSKKILNIFIKNAPFKFLNPLLLLISKNEWTIEEHIANDVANRLQESDITAHWNTRSSYIRRYNGTCSNCNHRLLPMPRISIDEFNSLKSTVLSKAVKREDIYLNTTPEELSEFRRFLDNDKPYDIVVDGMNCIYGGLRRSRILTKTDPVIVMVEKLREKGRILVVLKEHQRKQTKLLQNMDNVATFYTTDSTADDPFFLYAAFHSGPHCYIVTRDFLRKEAFKLTQSHKPLFTKWQRTNQIAPVFIFAKNKNDIILKWPWKHHTAIQSSQDGSKWHIPFNKGLNIQPTYVPPNDWICLQKVTKK